MKLDSICYDGSRKFSVSKFNTDSSCGIVSKAKGLERLAQNKEILLEQQPKLYAQGKEGIVVVFQAMDAAGKDGTIRQVFSGINPAGIDIVNFKTPSTEDLSHDYLWRIFPKLPQRGKIGVLNRSYYEDVLIVKVLNLPEQYNLPSRVTKGNIWKRRYRQIREFEQYLWDNGYTVLKFHLCISKEEQRQRFLSRLDDPSKNWKFTTSDLQTREKWKEYQSAYEDCINQTATEYAPWYVVPSDKKWVTHAVVSQVIRDTLKGMKLSYPEPISQEELKVCRERLEQEQW